MDEIHRFNRAQQDGFLPFVEQGVVTLVGATTENPSFELNGALLSRCQVLVLRRLDETALVELLERVEALTGRELPLTGDARAALVAMADGDGRYLLGMVEQVLEATAPGGLQPSPDADGAAPASAGTSSAASNARRRSARRGRRACRGRPAGTRRLAARGAARSGAGAGRGARRLAA